MGLSYREGQVMSNRPIASTRARQKAAVTKDERRRADLNMWVAALKADIHNARLIRRNQQTPGFVRWEFMMKGDDDAPHLLCVFNAAHRQYYLYVIGMILAPHDLVPFTDAVVALLPKEEQAVAIAAAMSRQ